MSRTNKARSQTSTAYQAECSIAIGTPILECEHCGALVCRLPGNYGTLVVDYPAEPMPIRETRGPLHVCFKNTR